MLAARRRSYASPLRDAAAAATRAGILSAARTTFEQAGWSGASLGLIARQAGVSPKTIQAQFGTKARLLSSTVDFAVRGDGDGKASGRRGVVQAIRQTPEARRALELHAAMSTGINSRAARLAAVVEAGAAADPAVAPLWDRMQENMRFGVRWAAEVMMVKRGLRAGLTGEAVESVFQVGMAWGTYRTLSLGREMSQPEIEAWIVDYYVRMLLA
jgi:AcrR family transcriptional regulator